jgi:phosphoribosylformylglycinamidine synthase
VLFAQNSAQPEWDVFKANMDVLVELGEIGCVRSAYPLVSGGLSVSLALMAFGNNTGIEAQPKSFSLAAKSAYQGSVVVEIEGSAYRENPRINEILEKAGCWEIAAVSIGEPILRITREAESEPQFAEVPLETLRCAYEEPLAKVYPQISGGQTVVGASGCEVAGSGIRNLPLSTTESDKFFSNNSVKLRETPWLNIHSGQPVAVLPVFPGTNCEWDMEQAFREAGAKTRQVTFRNRSREDIAESIRELAASISEAQILALSGGFSAGDEPDGSGKFIANVLRCPAIADAVNDLLQLRGGLMLGICNGFQALIKLGLVPYGVYREANANMPTLTYNRIGRHVSRMVRTRVMSAKSPWLALEEPGTIHVVPVSHGEGRLVIRSEEGESLFQNGQIPFCYADENGLPALHEPDNPNGSDFAIEGMTSPDGRILGKMSHSERAGAFVHINIPGNKKQRIFEAGVRYFM